MQVVYASHFPRGHRQSVGIEVVEQQLLEEGIVRAGDSLVFLAGMPSNRPGTTNMLRLHTVGDEVR